MLFSFLPAHEKRLSLTENNQFHTSQLSQVKEAIVREQPKINRNDNVTIKHVMSGKTETMRYKKAESIIGSVEWGLVSE